MRSSIIYSAVRDLSSVQSRKLHPISYTSKFPVPQIRKMASGSLYLFDSAVATRLIFPSAGSDLGIENTNIKTAPGVTLDEQQKTLVGSVLDVRLFQRLAYTARIDCTYSFLLGALR